MKAQNKPIKATLYEIIYESDTKKGKIFDILLFVAILISILAVVMETVDSFQIQYENELHSLEWFLTLLFTLEYLFRLYTVKRAHKYATSFYGIIDLLSILPTYLALIFVGPKYFLFLRVFRLLRVFRVLKLGRYIQGSKDILKALKDSRPKITVFLFFVLIVAFLVGSLMYVIEGGVNPTFKSIPTSIYWAIVTLTTVGYGDIAPVTAIGQFIASMMMILGYGILAVPTGLITAELLKNGDKETDFNTQVCPNCLYGDHSSNAIHCNQCGYEINEYLDSK